MPQQSCCIDAGPLACSIHTSGSKVLSRDHPDARAIFYENDTYSKRRINDLIAVLRAFESAAAVRDIFHKRRSSASAADADDVDETADFVRSPLLRHIVHNAFPNLRPLLAFFSRAFDKDKVRIAAGRNFACCRTCPPRSNKKRCSDL